MKGGNHELYRDEVVEYVQRPGGFIDWWGDKYLTSNIRLASDGKPFGRKYKVLKGRNSNVLVFGFLYSKLRDCGNILCVCVHAWDTPAFREQYADKLDVLFFLHPLLTLSILLSYPQNLSY